MADRRREVLAEYIGSDQQATIDRLRTELAEARELITEYAAPRTDAIVAYAARSCSRAASPGSPLQRRSKRGLMARSPLPSVGDARKLAQRCGADRVVVLYTTADGRIGYASYGVTRELCDQTQRLADELYGCAVAWLAARAQEGNDGF